MIHDINQMLADQAAENINVVTSNLKGYAVKPATTTKSRDKYYAYVKPITEGVNYYTGKYPDNDNCRLFIRSENFGEVFDYSLQGNQAKVLSDIMIQEIIVREESDQNIIGSEFVSYFNGSHWINVKDDRKLRLKDIIVDTPTKTGFCFVKRFNPLRYGNSAQDSIILTQKVDTSQNQYGYSLNLDDKGNLYFYVSFNYRLYYVMLKNAFQISLGDVDFYSANFNPKNFKTEVDSAEEWAKTMYDVACSFNFTTKEVKIRLRYKDKLGVEQTKSISSVNQIPTGLQLHLPMQEGKWSATEATPLNQVYDTSSNQLVGTIQSPLNAKRNDDNTLNHATGATSGYNITIPNNAAFNTFTEMTMAFWYKPLGNITLSNRIMMVGYDNTPHVKVHRNTDNSLSFTLSLSVDGSVFTTTSKSNVFSTLNQWVFIVVKWKTGENLKVSINDTADTATSSVVTGTFTQLTLPYTIYDWRPDNAVPINIMFWKRKITALEQTSLYELGAHLAQFPVNKEPQRTPQGTPAPITNPFAILYDLPKLSPLTEANYTFLNNPSAENPYVSKYNVAAGTPESIAKVTPYNVPDGLVVSGSPFVLESEYLTTDNSHGVLGSTNSRMAGVQIVSLSGRGLAINNKAITKAGFWLKKNNTVGGTLYCRIWNTATGAVIGNVGSMTNLDTTLTTTYTYYEFTNLANTTKLNGVGYMIGLEYQWASSGQEVSMQRIGSDADSTIIQGYSDDGIDWNTNSSFDIAYRVYTGQGSTSSNPFYTMYYGNYKRVAQYIGTGDAMIGKAPTEFTCKMYRDAGTISGTLVWKIWKAAGTIITLAAAALSVTTITTTTTGTVYTFQDFENPNTLAAGDRIGLEWVSQPISSVKVYIKTNFGNNAGANNYNTTASYFTLYQTSWTTTNTYDISGTMSYGGYSFSAIFKFTAAVTRVGQRATNNSAPFWNQLITRAMPKIKRTGSIAAPSTITCTIRRQSDNAVQKTIGTVDANSISTALFEDVPFTNIGSDYYIAAGDYICFELSTCTTTEYIEFSINKDVALNTTLVQHASNVTSDVAQYDLSGNFYVGGQIDATSRTRLGQYINTQDSLFMTTDNNKITYMEIPMYKKGAPTGTIYFNIRDENDVAVKTLGQISASGLSTDPAAPTIVPITDLTNTYILAAKNIITVEYEGGDQTNRVGVHTRTSTYDATESYLARYNGIEYDYNTAVKLVALMKTGGDTYTPDASDLPPDMPQSDTDLYIGVSGDFESEYTIEIFDAFVFATELLTDAQLDNFYLTRNDFESNAYNEILITNHGFINGE